MTTRALHGAPARSPAFFIVSSKRYINLGAVRPRQSSADTGI
jgi:hypothetical protein